MSIFGLRRIHKGLRMSIVAVLVLFWGEICLAQTNSVYSFWTGASTPLTGFRVAVVSASPVSVVGSAPNTFGIEECQYWTDSAGRAIPWPATRVRQPGDTRHCYTRFRLGRSALSIPLPPIGMALLTGSLALGLGGVLLARFTRRRAQTEVVPNNV